jgi:hypothetical protein
LRPAGKYISSKLGSAGYTYTEEELQVSDAITVLNNEEHKPMLEKSYTAIQKMLDSVFDSDGKKPKQ